MSYVDLYSPKAIKLSKVLDLIRRITIVIVAIDSLSILPAFIIAFFNKDLGFSIFKIIGYVLCFFIAPVFILLTVLLGVLERIEAKYTYNLTYEDKSEMESYKWYGHPSR